MLVGWWTIIDGWSVKRMKTHTPVPPCPHAPMHLHKAEPKPMSHGAEANDVNHRLHTRTHIYSHAHVRTNIHTDRHTHRTHIHAYTILIHKNTYTRVTCMVGKNTNREPVPGEVSEENTDGGPSTNQLPEPRAT